VSEPTAPAAVFDVLVTVFWAVEPAALTALAADGLEPARLDATDLATPPAVEPTVWPVLDTTWATVPPVLVTIGGGVRLGSGGGTVTGGRGPEPGLPPEGVEPVDPVPPGGWVVELPPPPPAAFVPAPAAVRGAPAATAAAFGCDTAATSSRPAREGVARLARETDTATGGGWLPTWGQPRNATIALASRNITAAPASNDPDVPNPARYPRVARTFDLYRSPAGKP
jgi:hypothetical protein